ncbi:MAG: hypothetical protein H8E66_00710 [Planctomycetes bacterium]|nr:hypothetical protein [Planctomycetota bacterium]
MSGITASILLRSAFTVADTGRVTRILRDLADDVTETRKGRHWEFTVDNAHASLSVLSTSDYDFDFEDDLLANSLLFEQAPEAFLLSFGSSRDSDREACSLLVARLIESFGGIHCGFGA